MAAASDGILNRYDRKGIFRARFPKSPGQSFRLRQEDFRRCRNHRDSGYFINIPSQDLPHRPTQIEDASRTQTLIEPLIALEAHNGVVMVASENGIYRRSKPESNFKDERYEKISRDTFSNLKDVITLPPDWLLLPTTHAIQASFDSGFARQSGDLGLDDLLDEESGVKPTAAEEDA